MLTPLPVDLILTFAWLNKSAINDGNVKVFMAELIRCLLLFLLC